MVSQTPIDEEKQHQARFEQASDVADKDARSTTAGTTYANSETGLAHSESYQKEERRIVRKLDRVILPLTALLYLSAYLDRYALTNSHAADQL
jgi:hypothetical protein